MTSDETVADVLRKMRGFEHGCKVNVGRLGMACGDYNFCHECAFDAMARIADRIEAAHWREMDAAYDPRRLRGTAESGSFAEAIEALREFRWQHATNDEDAIPYVNAVEDAHAREVAKLSGDERRESCKNGDSCKIGDGAKADISGHCPKSNETCPDDETEDGDEPRRDRVSGAHGAGGVEAVAGQPTQVTAELREWVEQAPRSYVDLRNPYDDEEYITGDPDALLAIADRMDEAVSHMMSKSEHRKRMEQSGHTLRKQNKRYRDRNRSYRDRIRALEDENAELLAAIASMAEERDATFRDLRDKLVDLRNACDAAARACGEATRDE